MIHSKDVAVKAKDAITLLGKVNHQMTLDESKDCKMFCLKIIYYLRERPFKSKQFLGDDLANNVKIAK